MVQVENRRRPGTPAWVGLMSHDPAAAQDFYGRLLGWDFEPGPAELSGSVSATLRGLPVAGLGRIPADALPSMWTAYLAVDSADGTADDIRSNGGTVAVGPLQLGRMGRRAVAADPLGAAFGIWEAEEFLGSEAAGEPGTLAWCELLTGDAEVAGAFYRAVFGLEPERVQGERESDRADGGRERADGGREDLVALRAGDRPVAWIRGVGDAAKAVGPRWLTVFRVADADRAADLASEAGGQVRLPPYDTRYGRMAGLEDPDGALFEVVGPLPM
ncbi:hypothetical protein BIV57_17500 [Mangrovactinospora gilvigrisea]|uniref:VOC domain-containing protein n=1 Tax=Mangrovactinospora gilvigrisea TaxID=1428644 RepID=A0A1J7C3S4_9ACTN|nr:VOC family protein [Mangrovactinospora gilvigrisea]OIV36200.1 hypothetical protein BIV57_17500 [Mangrovactinospora gilvigrisea]